MKSFYAVAQCFLIRMPRVAAPTRPVCAARPHSLGEWHGRLLTVEEHFDCEHKHQRRALFGTMNFDATDFRTLPFTSTVSRLQSLEIPRRAHRSQGIVLEHPILCLTHSVHRRGARCVDLRDVASILCALSCVQRHSLSKVTV